MSALETSIMYKVLNKSTGSVYYYDCTRTSKSEIPAQHKLDLILISMATRQIAPY